MKEFLTEWLILRGTNQTYYPFGTRRHDEYWQAKHAGFCTCTPEGYYQLTTKGLEYLKDERISD